ncbi:hypothetical protein HPB47_023689, partial [Ixodes persulcatus]
MNVAKLKEGLASGQLKLVTKDSKQSDVWKKFVKVVDATTSAPLGHVQCSHCKAFLTCDGTKTENSHWSRHK